MNEYEALKQRLAQGWNTWNTRSVLSHVHLPTAFALNLGFKDYASRSYLKEALIGRYGERDERIIPGPRSYDGSYTELTLTWEGIKARIQTGIDGDDWIAMVTPSSTHRKAPLLTVESGFLWNRPGYAELQDDGLRGYCPEGEFGVYSTRACVHDDPYIAAQTAYLAMPLDGPIGLSTGRPRTLAEITAILERRKAAHLDHSAAFGEFAEIYAAIQTCMAWDTVYDPEHDRVISPVSRLWNVHWGGYVLFDWDTYFAAYMAGLDNRDLAYANAIEITHEKTENGFIPNFATVSDVKSRDRSQPPVGSLVIRELYRRFGDRWLLEEVFDDLLEWNRWWAEHRADDGLLCWGSDPYTPRVDAPFESEGVNERFGAALESGLDNSPMYDDIPFNPQTHLMQLADVGLNGMYIMDCEALADIAAVLRREAQVTELRERAARFRAALRGLWAEETGLFLNRRTDTGEFTQRLSPTHFYALLGKAATQAQAERMINEHFYDPEEFWGEWIMPSIARNDPAYPDQNYWRGRIWAPMNLLAYLGLRNYDLPQAQRDLAEKSAQLLLKEWREHGHVHENYNGDTGEGCDVPNSDRFYHWGGLLGLIAMIEGGYLAGPETPLDSTLAES